jgi:hypothetical protein
MALNFYKGSTVLRKKFSEKCCKIQKSDHFKFLIYTRNLDFSDSFILRAMPHSAEFFRTAGNRNKILSAFTEAVKVTVFQKIGHR